MGRKKKALKMYGKEKNFNRPAGEGYSGGRDGPGYNLALRQNELFVKYYQGQGIVPEGEWEDFYETCRKNLLITFRITGYKSQSQEVLKNIKGKFFSKLLDVKVEDVAIPPPKSIEWYPDELAWQVDLTRKAVRSSEHLQSLHDFLISGTECGIISRQEAVSMIPPLMLDIKSHHKILDMCAAPGSKTAQLIEYMHADAPPGTLPTGYVMANDSDNKRCYLMVHQVKRLQSPCCVIVNHDGTAFPKIRTNSDDKNPQFQLFDRILCDVPCSGDGTMRKNYDVWTKWHPFQGANMHGLQSRILWRGCSLLAVGGRLVYSTCSLNPAEDEAVIADCLRRSQGAMRLVDIQTTLPALKYVKGMSTWKVMTKTGEWLDSPDELSPLLKTQFKPTVFPPTEKEAEEFNLDRCIRILPHQQDTGGFFVAVLEKLSHLPGSMEAKAEEKAAAKAAAAEGEKSAETAESAETKPTAGDKRKGDDATDNEPGTKKQRFHGFKEDPFYFMQEDNPIWPQIRDFFGMSETFPSSQLLYRSEKGQRTLYFVADKLRDVVNYNRDRIRFINMGVKAFSRSPSPLVPQCDFRITMESMNTILPFVTKRMVTVSKQDAITITSEENPFTDKLSEGLQQQLNNLPAGSTIFEFNPSAEEPSPNCDILFCGWRGKTSVRCFGSRFDRAHILNLLGEDLKEINKKVQEKKQAKAEAKALAESGEANANEDIKTENDDHKDTSNGDTTDDVKIEIPQS